MYNGIGLQTPRGSGTNGHVQRNWAVVRTHNKDKLHYRTEEELSKLNCANSRQPNKEILDHERKRKIELKCVELEEILEEKGYTKEAIEAKVENYRKMLIGQDGKLDLPKNEWGKITVTETHQVAEAQHEKNAKLREAFGISEYFVDGSSFDPDRAAKEQMARAAASQEKEDNRVAENKRYELVRTPSPEPEITKQKKRKHKSKDRTSSEDRKKKKKSKKHKREKLEKSREKKKVKRHRYKSNASSSSSSDESSDSSNEDEKRKKKKSKKKEKRRISKKKNYSTDSSSESSLERPRKKSNPGTNTEKSSHSKDTDVQNKKKTEKIKDTHVDKSDSKRSSQDKYNASDNKTKRSKKSKHSSPPPKYQKKSEEHKSKYYSAKHDKVYRHSRSRSKSNGKNSQKSQRLSRYESHHDSPELKNKESNKNSVKKHENDHRRYKTSYSPKTKSSGENLPSRQSSPDHNKKQEKNISPKKPIVEHEKLLTPPHETYNFHSETKKLRSSKSASKNYSPDRKNEMNDIEYIRKIKSRNKSTISIPNKVENQTNDLPLKASKSNKDKNKHKSTSNNNTEICKNYDENKSSDKKISPAKSPGVKNKYTALKPVVRLRSSSEDSESDHSNFKIDEEHEKELFALQLLKTGLAAKAKDSLERKLPKLNIPNHSEMKINTYIEKISPQKSPVLPENFSEMSFGKINNKSISVETANDGIESVKSQQATVNEIREPEMKVEKDLPAVREISWNEITEKDTEESMHGKRNSHSRSSTNSPEKNKERKSCTSRSSYSSSHRSNSISSSGSSRSRSGSRSRSRSRSVSRSRSFSHSYSGSSSSRSISRSPSIPRRHGSPSFLDRRRITSARKRPIPYHRPTPSSPSASSWTSNSNSPWYLRSPRRNRSASRSPCRNNSS